MDKPIIFVGPSLDVKKAKKIFDADYRPSAKKGDFIGILSGLSDVDPIVVGLIDGLFLQDYPPTPIEVYQLLRRRNSLVLGGASLGALRAVELEKYGMIGVGKIFELYKLRKFTADDEVAVTFNEETQHLQSEAMIDIRYNLLRAFKEGVIDEDTRMTTVKVAKSMYFPDRNYVDIMSETAKRFPHLSESMKSLSSFIINKRQSLKEKDAVRLIVYAKTLYESKSTI